MTPIADFSVPTEAFALSHTLKAVPEVKVEVERVVAHDSDERLTPYFWVAGDDLAEFEGLLDDDPSIENVTTLEALEDERFYRGEWTRNVDSILYALSDVRATVLNATGRAERWEIRMLFADSDALSEFQDYCATYELSFDLSRLYDVTNPKEPRGRFDLTEAQRDALVRAFEAGYFEVPRGITQAELADALDVSHQALSEQLRRGQSNLVESTLVVDR